MVHGDASLYVLTVNGYAVGMTTQTSNEPAAALLGKIRERAEVFRDAGLPETPLAAFRSARDVPRLLLALDEVLNLTEPGDEVHYSDPEHPLVRVIRCDEIREAISRALSGGAA